MGKLSFTWCSLDFVALHKPNITQCIGFFYINQVRSADIPQFRQRQIVLLTISVSKSDSDFTDTVEVYVSPKSGYLFLTTDRPIYK